MASKKVGIQLPKQAQNQTVEARYALELEGVGRVADIIEIRADTPAEFAAGRPTWTRSSRRGACASTGR